MNPVFAKSIGVSYLFEEVQTLQVRVFDVDSTDARRPQRMSLIGRAEFLLPKVVHSSGNKLELDLVDEAGKSSGKVDISHSKSVKGPRTLYRFAIEASGFNVDFMVYKLYKQLDNGEYHPVFESETAEKENGTHRFIESKVDSIVLLENDRRRRAKIEFFQWYSSD